MPYIIYKRIIIDIILNLFNLLKGEKTIMPTQHHHTADKGQMRANENLSRKKKVDEGKKSFEMEK